MKAFLLMTGSGPLIILTSHDDIENSILLDKLLAKGIEKFIAYEVPFDLARQRYGGHFTIVANDLHEPLPLGWAVTQNLAAELRCATNRRLVGSAFSQKLESNTWPRSRFLERFCYTRLRRKTMKLRSESYPDRIRRIAQEVSQLRNLYQVDHSVEKLRLIANELEQVLKKTPLKKAWNSLHSFEQFSYIQSHPIAAHAIQQCSPCTSALGLLSWTVGVGFGAWVRRVLDKATS
jgi:hypothetical protein